MIKLFHDKCEQALSAIPDHSIDLLLTDLPYGILNTKVKKLAWDNEIDYDIVLPELERIMKPAGTMGFFAKAPFTYRLYNELEKMKIFHWTYNWVWKKSLMPNFGCLKWRPGSTYEEILVCRGKGRNRYFPQGVIQKPDRKEKLVFWNKHTFEEVPGDLVFDNLIAGKVFSPEIETGTQCCINATANGVKSANTLLKELDTGTRIPHNNTNGNGRTTVTSLLEELDCNPFIPSISSSGCQQSVKGLINELDTGTCLPTATNSTRQPVTGLRTDIMTGTRLYNGFTGLEGEPDKLIFDIATRNYTYTINFKEKAIYRTFSSYTGYPTNILSFPNPAGKEKRLYNHPTQKPVDLLRYLIKTYTEPGDTVLDICMGSGSTGEAAIREGRDFYGIEMTDKWYEVAKSRLESLDTPEITQERQE